MKCPSGKTNTAVQPSCTLLQMETASALIGKYLRSMLLIGCWLLTFQDNISVPSSRVKQSKKIGS